MRKKAKKIKCNNWGDDGFIDYIPNNKKCPICGTEPYMYHRIGGEAKIACKCRTIMCGRSASMLRKWWNTGGWQYMRDIEEHDKAFARMVDGWRKAGEGE